MIIGIVGPGKMGLGLFALLQKFPRIQRTVLICPDSQTAAGINEKLYKKLLKKVQKGLMPQGEVLEILEQFFASADYADLAACDIVIETVWEELSIKQEVVQKIAAAVNDGCVIMSNTSSLDICGIFINVSSAMRCGGMHFFYPVSIWPTVEISFVSDDGPPAREQVEHFLAIIQKMPLYLPISESLVISRLLTALSAYVYDLYVHTDISFLNLESLVKKEIMMFGVFEISDTTGFHILKKCLDNLGRQPHEKMIKNLRNAIAIMEKSGYKAFACAIKDGLLTKAGAPMILSGREITERIESFVIDEIAYYCGKGAINRDQLIIALRDAIGLNDKIT